MSRHLRILLSVAFVTVAATALGGPGASGQAPTPTAKIGGPDSLRLTEPALFLAAVEPDAVRHLWDMDGDGKFDRNTGPRAEVHHGFEKPGTFTVTLRAELADGSVATATKQVVVQRPTLMGLGLSTANPKPGQRITFRAAPRGEEASPIRLFSWRFRGLSPVSSRLGLAPVKAQPAGSAQFQTARPPLISLKGAQPTRQPGMSRALPKTGVQKIDVKGVDTYGQVSELHTGVGVSDGDLYFTQSPGKRQGVDTKIVDCNTNADWEGPCAGFGVLGQPAVGVKTVFQAADLSIEVCVPVNVNINQVEPLSKLKAALDLPYPADNQWQEQMQFDGQQFDGGQQFGGGQQIGGAGKANSALDIQYDCDKYPARARYWNLGDGTTIGAPNSAANAPEYVEHRYTAKGKYNVTHVASIPVVKQGGDGEGFHGFYHVEYVLSRITEQIEVVEPHCGLLHLHGVPVSTTLGRDQTDFQGADGCFIKRERLDDSPGYLYEPFPGFDVDLNTIWLEPRGPGGIVRPPVIVDEVADSITLMGDLHEDLVAHHPDRGSLFQFDSLVVPERTRDPDVNKDLSVIAIGLFDPSPFHGLKIVSPRVMLSRTEGAYLKFNLELPKPVRGSTPPTVLGGGPQALRSSTAEDDLHTDFELDLSGLDLGFFRLENFNISHRVAGGWFGGGNIFVPALGAGLLAEYKRPPENEDDIPSNCPLSSNDVVGPSGLSISENGDFEFGGAALVAKVPLGPIELQCIYAGGKSDPFYIVGKVRVGAPVGEPLVVANGCFVVAVLKEGDNVPGQCESNGFTANQDLTWFRAQGKVDLADLIPLGSAYFDLKKGSQSTKIELGGEMDYTFEDVVGLKVGFDGKLYFNPFQFEIYGHGEVCFTLCASVEAIVSSNGVGACAWVGGFEYFWEGGLELFLGCDMSDSDLHISRSLHRVYDRPSGAPVFGGTAATSINVPDGLEKVGIHVRGSGGAPRPTITGPDGFKITAQEESLRTGKFHVARWTKTGDTFIVIKDPAPGTYRVDAQSDTPAIAGISLSKPLKEPRVLGRVSSTGRKRTLQYQADLAPGDKLHFTEEGRTIARVIGGADRPGGRGSFSFLTGNDSPGQRTIHAVVVRRGLPYKRFKIGGYKAPRIQKPRAPRQTRAVRLRGDRVGIKWTPVRGARGYQLVATLGDGKVVRLFLKKPQVILGGISRQVGLRLEVRTLGQGTLQSAPRAGVLNALPAVQAKLGL